ncbi:MAG: tetratricopeptide repeat protein [Myxococcota bacterium]
MSIEVSSRPARPLRTRIAALATAVALALSCSLSDPAVQAHIETARQLVADGRHEEALAELEVALQIDPESAEAHANAGLVLLQLERGQEALAHFEEAFRIEPRLVRAGIEAALLHLRANPLRSLELADRVVELAPDNQRVRNVRIDALVRLQRFADATDAARSLAGERPDDVRAQLRLGQVIVARARQEVELSDELMAEAARAFEAAGDLAPPARRPGIRLQRAHLLDLWPGHEEEANAAHRELLEQVDAPPRVRLAAIDAVTGFARRHQDWELLDRALRLRLAGDRELIPVWQELARTAELASGDGLALLDAALEGEDAKNPAVHIARARWLTARARPDEAVASLLEAAEGGWASDQLLDAAVEIEVASRRLAAAHALAQRIESELPDSPYAAISRARIDLRLGRYLLVEAALEELVATRESALALRLLAAAKQRLKQSVSAVKAMERARELDPIFDERVERRAARRAHGAAMPVRVLSLLKGLEDQGFKLSALDHLMSAQAMYLIGEREKAERLLESLVSIDEPSPAAIVEYSTRYRTSRPDRVRELLEAARARYPRNRALLVQLLRLELAEGRHQEVLATIESSLEDGRKLSHDLFLIRTRAYIAQERIEEAQKDLLSILRLHPSSRRALDLLSRLYEEEDRMEELVSSFDAAADAGTLKDAGSLIAGRLHMRIGDYEGALSRLEPLLAAEEEAPAEEAPPAEEKTPGEPQLETDLAEDDPSDDSGAPSGRRSHAIQVDVARCLAETGRDLPRAIALGRDGLELGRDVEAHVALGLAHLRSRELSRAEMNLHRAVELSRSLDWPSAAAHRYLGETYREQGRSAEARAAFERAIAVDSRDASARRALAELDAEATGSESP